MEISGTLTDMVRCEHAPPTEVAPGVEWCARCGAIRFGSMGDRSSLQWAGWFRPLAVSHIDSIMGRGALSSSAEACLREIERAPAPLRECLQRFGGSALLELVGRELVDVVGESGGDPIIAAKAGA